MTSIRNSGWKSWLLTPAAVLVLSFISGSASAGLYVSGALGLSDHRFANAGNALGVNAGIGYRPAQGGFGGELKYIDAGSARVRGSGDLKMSGTNAAVVYWIPNDNPELSYMHGYVRLGIYGLRTTYAASSEYDTGYSAGLGFEFRVRPQLGLYADFDGFILIDATNDHLDNLSVWSFGVRYHF